LAPTTSAAQSSPTWRIRSPSDGLSPSASAAAAKIAGCGLIVPTRCETTIERRCGNQPCASAKRSIVRASGQLDRIANAKPRPDRRFRVSVASATGSIRSTNAALYASTT
jgi:hypothetical protein